MIVKGLSHIHCKEIIHCDLKLENILLFPSDMPSYLSSEVFSGHIDAPMDIWALGCIVIEMLTELPAWGESFLSTEEYLRFFIEYLELLPKKAKGISFFCCDFLEKCFIKDPSKRWIADMLLDHHFL
ncbi:mitogen-activated protein kinase kinase kinase A-like [Arachis ipaensis]|nr:mitogen-activated protein kinase kinase kinase A-like [Arachis ipaensis]